MALPSGYTELEYIQSSGTQYINTGINMTADTDFDIEFEITSRSTVMGIIGIRDTGTSNGFMLYSDNTQFIFMLNTSYTNIQNSSNILAKHVVSKRGNSISFDGVATTLPSTSFTGTYPLGIFCFMQGTSAISLTSMRLFSLTLIRNNTPIANYVPSQNANGVVGVYEQIAGNFLSNAGSGIFQAGPVVKPVDGVVAIQNVQLAISTSATITLDLVVTDPVTGDPLNVTINSVSGTVNDTATTWTLSGGLWTTTAPLSELGQYLCVFDVATSDGKTVEMRLPLYYGVLSLITDRAQSDVDELLSLLRTPFADWTAEQAQLFYSGMSKGAYNASDLNRVGAAMVYIAERISSMGYSVADIAPKLYWMDTDTVTQSDMSAYLSDLAALRAVLELPGETPTVPADMAELTFAEANDIEQILTIINTIITNITLAYRYAGELYGGEV